MTPLYHTQISQIHFGEGDQHQSYIPLFTVPCSIPFDKYKQDHRTPDAERLLQHRSQLQEQTVQGSTWSNYVASQSSLCQFVREGEEQGPIKWMSSKMRIMRKMMNSDQPTITSKSRRSTNHQQPNQEISGENTLRVCSDCNTTKTPLWRSGPQGPKSLCNACGIRQRKARRAMAASSDVDRMMPFKKRCRFAAAENTKRKVCFEDIVIRLSKSTVCQRSFPQDEKDAAILLMALSCGLICN